MTAAKESIEKKETLSTKEELEALKKQIENFCKKNFP
jgi:hypothetical protein